MINNKNSARVEQAGLCIIRNLLEEFNRLNIQYCHWKSNEHLDAAVNGDTDLDILFVPEERATIIELLNCVGFRLFVAPKWRRYPGIEDYIGIDPETGKIVHVHAHFGLVLGEKWVKNYRLPWDKEILDKRVFDEEYHIYTITPEFELFLLIIRFAIKCKKNQKWSDREYPEVVNYLREARWLKERVSQEQLLNIFQQKFGDIVIETFTNIFQSDFQPQLFLQFKKVIKDEFKQFRRLSSLNAVWIQYYRKSIFYASRILVKIGIVDFTPKRSLPKEGIVISIMGADGAGKSTQTMSVCKELDKKVDVQFVYLGSGQGSMSLQRAFLKILLKGGSFIFKAKEENGFKKDSKSGIEKKSIKKNSICKDIANILIAFSVAREKKSKLNGIRRAKKRGTIIVCDRFPQIQIKGYNDGPKLSEYLDHKWSLFRRVASYEYSIYKMCELIYPDLVLKLLADPEILFQRRSEMTLEMIKKKQNGIKSLSFSDYTKVVNIDANNNMDEVEKCIMVEIGIFLTHYR